MEQQSSVKRQRRRVQATGDEDSGSLILQRDVNSNALAFKLLELRNFNVIP